MRERSEPLADPGCRAAELPYKEASLRLRNAGPECQFGCGTVSNVGFEDNQRLDVARVECGTQCGEGAMLRAACAEDWRSRVADHRSDVVQQRIQCVRRCVHTGG